MNMSAFEASQWSQAMVQ